MCHRDFGDAVVERAGGGALVPPTTEELLYFRTETDPFLESATRATGGLGSISCRIGGKKATRTATLPHPCGGESSNRLLPHDVRSGGGWSAVCLHFFFQNPPPPSTS